MESYPNPEDLEYEPKISESTNYLKFLKLTHDGHHSEDEGHYDSEGYYEDDIVGDIVRTESDQNFLYSDLPEVGKDALQIIQLSPLKFVWYLNGMYRCTADYDNNDNNSLLKEGDTITYNTNLP